MPGKYGMLYRAIRFHSGEIWFSVCGGLYYFRGFSCKDLVRGVVVFLWVLVFFVCAVGVLPAPFSVCGFAGALVIGVV